jgi:hypothetical protein
LIDFSKILAVADTNGIPKTFSSVADGRKLYIKAPRGGLFVLKLPTQTRARLAQKWIKEFGVGCSDECIERLSRNI